MSVATDSGWSALVQDTGFGRRLPVGDGADRILTDYARAAREVAAEHFDSDKVLARFLDEVGVGS